MYLLLVIPGMAQSAKKKQLKEATLFESFGQNLFFLEMPILAHCA